MDLNQQIIEAAPYLNKDVVQLLVESIRGNTTMIWKIVGICVTCFVAMGGWIYVIASRMHIPKQFEDDISKLTDVLKEIRDALIGTLQTKGLITRHYDLEKRVEALEEKKKADHEKSD